MTNYLIWMNSLTRNSNSEITAVIELKPMNISQVASGSQEFVQGISDAFHLPLQVKTWSISPFRSAYYSDYPKSGDWEDRFPMFWRITLTGLASNIAPDPLPALSPIPYDGYDSTWHPLREPPASADCSYMAIGVNLGTAVTEGSVIQRVRSIWPGAPVQIVKSDSRGITGTKICLDLGSVNLELQHEDVISVDEQLGRLGMLTLWSQVKIRMTRFTQDNR